MYGIVLPAYTVWEVIYMTYLPTLYGKLHIYLICLHSMGTCIFKDIFIIYICSAYTVSKVI